MAWLIQSSSEGPVILADIGLTFTGGQIKNVDLIGRHNAEKSNDLKLMLQKGFLKELRKDSSDEVISPKLVENVNNVIQKANEIIQEAQATAKANNEKIESLEKKNEELHSKMDVVLREVQSFAEKFPIEIKTIAEALRNASGELGEVKENRANLSGSGESEVEIKTQERILALKEKKLEKNVKNLGSTVSGSATDYKESLDAMDQLGF